MRSKQKVAIVILNWNQKADTLACLSSLMSVLDFDVRILLIDNGSTDGSAAAIRAAFNSVDVLEAKGNQGCSGGRNQGLQYAAAIGAEYVLFLDNDTIVRSDFLTPLIELMESDPTIGICGSTIARFDNTSLVWIAGGTIDEHGIQAGNYYGQSLDLVPRSVYDVQWVPGCVLFAKVELARKIGLFDDEYFIYFEDIDWCTRAIRSGYRIVVEPSSVVYHKVSQSLGGSTSPAKLYYMSRNRLLFVSRYIPKNRLHHALLNVIRAEFEDGRDDLREGVAPNVAVYRLLGVIDFFRQRFGYAPAWMHARRSNSRDE
jgi:hypothetical protein